VAQDGDGIVNVIDQASGNGWHIYNADCVEAVGAMPDASVDFSIYSPPFASLYTYSNSGRDMGNVRDDAEFAEHFAHLTPHLFRVLKPGRLMAVHCMLLPASKTRDGFIGLKDFRGDLIRIFQRAGFIFHSEVTIWKNPVTAMQRTKALGLLHKTIRSDSAKSRAGIADFLVVMVKPGENAEPIAHPDDSFPVDRWQRYASPVWATSDGADDDGMLTFRDPRKGEPETDSSGIDATDTLQYMSARDDDDEKHICPLQLGVIRRAVRLWTNPKDVVLSPFAGIGSEGYVSVQEGRRYVGTELKPSYYRLAVRNLQSAEPNAKGKTIGLLDRVAV
jgi:DNA modification methylase